jgi:hypothetical protein
MSSAVRQDNLASLRSELRELRKESVKPVSRMKKGDIIAELERSHRREEKMEKVMHREEESVEMPVVKRVLKKEHKKQEEAEEVEHKKEIKAVKKVVEKKSPKVKEPPTPVKKASPKKN